MITLDHDIDNVIHSVEIIEEANLQALGFWANVKPVLKTQFEQCFWAGGNKRNAGGGWSPISPGHAAGKARAKKQGKARYDSAMKMTGRLHDAAVNFRMDQRGNRAILGWSAKSVCGFDYAGFHQREWVESPIYRWSGNPGFGGRPVELTDSNTQELARRAISMLHDALIKKG